MTSQNAVDNKLGFRGEALYHQEEFENSYFDFEPPSIPICTFNSIKFFSILLFEVKNEVKKSFKNSKKVKVKPKPTLWVASY